MDVYIPLSRLLEIAEWAARRGAWACPYYSSRYMHMRCIYVNIIIYTRI